MAGVAPDLLLLAFALLPALSYQEVATAKTEHKEHRLLRPSSVYIIVSYSAFI